MLVEDQLSLNGDFGLVATRPQLAWSSRQPLGVYISLANTRWRHLKACYETRFNFVNFEVCPAWEEAISVSPLPPVHCLQRTYSFISDRFEEIMAPRSYEESGLRTSLVVVHTCTDTADG